MTQRSIPICIILSIVTCGIYGIYWFVVLTDDVNAVAGDTQAPSGVVCFLLSLVTCGIYGLYWNYKQGEKLDYVKTSQGYPSSNSGILYLILSLIGLSIVSYALMQNELNKFTYMP